MYNRYSTIWKPDSSYVNNWALSNYCDGLRFFTLNYILELIDKFILNDVPKLHAVSWGKKQFINICSRMHHNIKIVIKILSLNDSTSLDIKDYELPILSKRKNELWWKDELNNWFCMTLIFYNLVHFLPLYYLHIIKGCIDISISRGL